MQWGAICVGRCSGGVPWYPRIEGNSVKIKGIEAMQAQNNLKYETAKTIVKTLDQACQEVRSLGMPADEVEAWREEILELVTGE
jgi:hypothetical protein